MIIVEGMDGSGKTSLVERLNYHLRLPIHARASSSLDGPVPNLFQWALADVIDDQQEFSVYDRHPLVSEYIYGPITRGQMDPRFFTAAGRAISSKFRARNMVIFCDPGLDEVKKNLARDTDQMEGVRSQLEPLYWAYKTFAHYWPGRRHMWNYLEDDYDTIVGICMDQRKRYESRKQYVGQDY